MKSPDELNAILAADFDYLAEITDNTDTVYWADDDIEAVMERHNIGAEDAVCIMKAMISAHDRACVAAVKAADKGAAEAVNAVNDPSNYEDIWLAIHDSVRAIEYKALAKVQ